jgi:hypothetical protein
MRVLSLILVRSELESGSGPLSIGSHQLTPTT